MDFLATGLAPWIARVGEIKASLAVNVEAERKVTQLNEEIQELARGIRSRDQTIQETSVKVELMERRMDTVKKQQDTIAELEAEIAAAKKSQRSYEDAVEQLHADLDAAEQEITKLKTLTAGMERQSESLSSFQIGHSDTSRSRQVPLGHRLLKWKMLRLLRQTLRHHTFWNRCAHIRIFLIRPNSLFRLKRYEEQFVTSAERIRISKARTSLGRSSLFLLCQIFQERVRKSLMRVAW